VKVWIIKLAVLLIAASLLIVSANAFAGKTIPEDCPCYFVEGTDNDMLDALAGIDTCTVVSNSTRSNTGQGNFQKSLWLQEDTGGQCAQVIVTKGQPSSCKVTGANSLSPGACQQVWTTGNIVLTDSQVKACEVALREITREARSIEDC